METWASVRHLHSQGLSCRAIARKLDLSRNTVRKYLVDSHQPHYTPRPGDPELLGPYTDHLRARLTEFPELTSTRLLGEIRERGFRGSYSAVLRFLRPLRREREVTAVYRFETAPGLQAQVDWAYFGTIEEDGRRKKLFAFLMTFGYSRAKYVDFTTDLSTPTFLACHLRAFEYFGGHTKEALYDNTKNVILWRAVGIDRNHFNPLFLDFAAYYGITPRLCAVYRAHLWSFRPTDSKCHMILSGSACRLRIHLSAPKAHDEIRGHRLPHDAPQSDGRDRLTTSQSPKRGPVVQECKGCLV